MVWGALHKSCVLVLANTWPAGGGLLLLQVEKLGNLDETQAVHTQRPTLTYWAPLLDIATSE